MEIGAALRDLWAHRVLVSLAAVLAILASIFLSYRVAFPPRIESRQYHVGIASATALVDTPRSQVVDLGGKDDTTNEGGTLPSRASLLANLMASSPLKEEIARRAGVAPDKLIAIAPSGVGVPAPTPLVSGATVTADDPKANVLTTNVLSSAGQLPIIVVNTQAPDVAVAARLANGAIASLTDYLGTVAATDRVPSDRRLVVKQLGPASVATASRGPRRLFGLIAAIFVFGTACAMILFAPKLARGWRVAAALQRSQDDVETGDGADPRERWRRRAPLAEVARRRDDDPPWVGRGRAGR
jgi:hypothetical protein